MTEYKLQIVMLHYINNNVNNIRWHGGRGDWSLGIQSCGRGFDPSGSGEIYNHI